VETAVRASVRQAAAEVLRDPGTLQRLREALAPAPVPPGVAPRGPFSGQECAGPLGAP